MSQFLYSFLPTELVWKIYDDLHASHMRDLNKEFLDVVEDYEPEDPCYDPPPWACLIGDCDCEQHNWREEQPMLLPLYMSYYHLGKWARG